MFVDVLLTKAEEKEEGFCVYNCILGSPKQWYDFLVEEEEP